MCLFIGSLCSFRWTREVTSRLVQYVALVYVFITYYFPIKIMHIVCAHPCRASEFTSSPPPYNAAPGAGSSVPYRFTHCIDADISFSIFDGAFRASALVPGLKTRDTSDSSGNAEILVVDLVVRKKKENKCIERDRETVRDRINRYTRTRRGGMLYEYC